jgi:hypothetical protein
MTPASVNSDMRLGIVAICDFLGFKGIWKQYPPKDVAQVLRAQRTVWSAVQLQAASRSAPHKLRGFMISDTLMLAYVSDLPLDESQRDPEARVRAGELVSTVVTLVQLAGTLALGETPELIFRGCIAAGPTYDDDGYLIGEAVDLAAEDSEEAEGAFIWLHETAERLLESAQHQPEHLVLAPPYPVPTKSGTVERRVVNPFGMCSKESEMVEQEQKILGTFTDSRRWGGAGPTPSVLAKQANTRKFLSAMRAATLAYWDAINSIATKES